ncbi:transposable element Tcb2 transposase [Trichonephila clavipes]|nr:transposable element Tcb2 transposase [Trichonephila clavipes]
MLTGAYWSCFELVVGIASTGQLPDLDAIDRWTNRRCVTHAPFNFPNHQTAKIFKQASCTFYESRFAAGWLDEHSSDFSVINWPSRSLELNPIQHLWDVLEQGVEDHNTAPVNLPELRTG